MGGTVSTPGEESATNGHVEETVEAAAEPLLGHHPAKLFDLRSTFSAPLAILTGVIIALFFVFVRQASSEALLHERHGTRWQNIFKQASCMP